MTSEQMGRTPLVVVLPIQHWMLGSNPLREVKNPAIPTMPPCLLCHSKALHPLPHATTAAKIYHCVYSPAKKRRDEKISCWRGIVIELKE